MHIKLLLIGLFQFAFAATNRECVVADITSLDAKYKKFNEEMITVLKNKSHDNASVKVLVDNCEELLKEGEAMKCSEMQEITDIIKKTCQIMKSIVPFTECRNKMSSSTPISECVTWLIADRNNLSLEAQCAGFRQRKDCIQKEVGKLCGAETEKNFKEVDEKDVSRLLHDSVLQNNWIFEKMTGCA